MVYEKIRHFWHPRWNPRVVILDTITACGAVTTRPHVGLATTTEPKYVTCQRCRRTKAFKERVEAQRK